MPTSKWSVPSGQGKQVKSNNTVKTCAHDTGHRQRELNGLTLAERTEKGLTTGPQNHGPKRTLEFTRWFNK